MLRNIFLGWILYVLIVPFAGANPATDSTTTAPATPVAEEVQKVNINTADAANLAAAELEGIGEKKAAAIVEFREKNGPFKVPADIMQVPGIGEKIFEKNKDRIVTSLPTDKVEEASTDGKTAGTPAETAIATPPPAPSAVEPATTSPPSEGTVEAPPQNENKTEEGKN